MKNMMPRKNSMFKEGFFRPKNPDKYYGDLNRIIYRSSLELAFYEECDRDKSVVKWSVEPPWLEIKYLSPKDGKMHRYFPDVYCEKIVEGTLKRFIVEVKPKSKTIAPKKPNLTLCKTEKELIRVKRRYEISLISYKIIMAKKQYAEEFAKVRNLTYIFLTERYIKRLSLRK